MAGNPQRSVAEETNRCGTVDSRKMWETDGRLWADYAKDNLYGRCTHS